MKTVTVLLEDLEALVFATGAIKTIEGVLASRKEDPFVKPYLAFTDAHDRCAAAVRNAKRADADTLVKFDEPLSKEERELLQQIANGEISGISMAAKIPPKGAPMSTYDRLSAKGCAQMGTLVHGVVWAGETKPALTLSPEGYAVRITARGQQKLTALHEPAA